MSDTLILSRQEPAALPNLKLEHPTARLRGRTFAETLEGQREPRPVVEVLEAVETDFRQGEASMLSIINSALSKDCMTKQQLLHLRARMKRYSFEVNALAALLNVLVRDLRTREGLEQKNVA